MNILELPFEIIVKITNYLDVKTKLYLYDTCKVFRAVLFEPGVMSKINLARGQLATSCTLDHNFFHGYTSCIKYLNLRSIVDLSERHINCIKTLNNLYELDIAYTNLELVMIMEIIFATNIKRLILFLSTEDQMVIKENLNIYEKGFGKLEFAHFFIEWNNEFNTLQCISNLMEVNITCCNRGVIFGPYSNYSNFHMKINMKNLRKFTLFFPHISELQLSDWHLIPLFDSEFCIFVHNEYQMKIFTSPYIHNIIKSNIEINNNHITVKANIDEVPYLLIGSLTCLLWKKTDDKINILKDVQNIIIDYICYLYPVKNEDSCSCVICSCQYIVQNDNYIVDVNSVIKAQHKTLKLSHICKNSDETKLDYPLNLITSENKLKNLTTIIFEGIVLTENLLFNLFSECKNLVTLSIETYNETNPPLLNFNIPVFLAISKTIHLCKNIRNFRIFEREIDIKLLFESLSNCVTLENIKVKSIPCSVFTENSKNAIVSTIEKCKLLYTLSVMTYPLPEDDDNLEHFLSSIPGLDQRVLHIDVNEDYNSIKKNPIVDIELMNFTPRKTACNYY